MFELSDNRLPWLTPAPADFRAQVKALGQGPVTDRALMRLALHDLDLTQLTKLDRARQGLGDAVSGSALSPVKLALLLQGTADYLGPALRATGLRHGIDIETYTPDYGQTAAEAMMPGSGLERFGADMALIAETPASLGIGQSTLDAAAAAAAVEAALGQMRSLIEGVQARGIATVILETLVPPADPWAGHLDARAPGSVAAQVAAFNSGLATLAGEVSGILLDTERLSALVGRARWHDTALWHRTKVAVALDLLPLYADHIARILRALRGKAAKCLVLDLDNTCWGGIIGDDGVEGIAIGQGSAAGEAHLAVQTYALSLKARGVVLAVCSKNEEAAAKLPFETHPDMALRLDDIAVFVANWTDKASNLAHIAKVLNIGTDALVFLDDNPAERARVRQMLPEVSVPEVGEDPASYASALAQGGYFETVALSTDDAKRAEQYRANAARAVAMEKIGDYGDYLRSLEMVCALQPFDATGRVRIAQLINKSNQFNLTTRRYTEAEVAGMETDPNLYTLQVRLTDKFGDNGMISVLIARAEGEAWVIDTWLMSCRVLGRRVEEAMLGQLVQAAAASGAKTLYGDYLPSAKNAMVAEHYPKLGFDPAGALPGDGARYALDLSAYVQPDLPMQLVTAKLQPAA